MWTSHNSALSEEKKTKRLKGDKKDKNEQFVCKGEGPEKISDKEKKRLNGVCVLNDSDWINWRSLIVRVKALVQTRPEWSRNINTALPCSHHN